MQRPPADPPRFRSFWMGGFESACHINRHGVRLDLVRTTGHEDELDADFARLREVGILTARENVRWREIDRGKRFDVRTLVAMLEAARRQGIQPLWTLFHYGWPDDVSIFSPAFVDRFSRYARAVARCLADAGEERPVVTPVNEISFFAWAAGDAGLMYPHGRGLGAALKRQLVRAAIAAMDAVWDVLPGARFLHAEPLIHVVPPRDRPDLARRAADDRSAQFEAFDMLAGGLAPELGGLPRYLDLVGVNFYPPNEWEYPDRPLRWDPDDRDPRWVPLADLLAEVHARYNRPIVIAETSHVADGRGPWLRDVAGEVVRARARGIPVIGVCLFPAVDRPDWDDPSHWHRSGIWDVVREPDGRLRRVPCEDYLAALREARALVDVADAAVVAG
ncbi:MAG TPA: hypothetical protein VNK43_00085 [Gemmatimonadales bacterium]|nr:hypothetical protein [Gemmatimonadales bacterium]